MATKCNSSRDVISELPAEIKERILERLPTRDAARTAILSTGWRDVWLGLGRIVVDSDLLQCVQRRQGDKTIAFVNMINVILLRQAGPVKKFTLCIYLSSLQLQQSDFDRWFLFLSRNGIQELKIFLADWGRHEYKYKLPYCILTCPTIKKLKLGYFVFYLPIKACSIFSGLTSLVFEGVKFSDELNGIVYKIPNLEKLEFDCFCFGISNFKIRVPKLESLSITSCIGAAELRWFAFHLKAIKTLCLGHFLLFFKLEDFVLAPLMFPTAINLQVIKLYSLNFAREKQFTVALQLLKNSPNLCELEIIASYSTYLFDDTRLPEDHGYIIDQDLKMLHTLKIESFRGSKVQMYFVKMLLSKCPALEKVVIQGSDDLNPSAALKISKELLRFPRASPKAQVVYMDYNFRYKVISILVMLGISLLVRSGGFAFVDILKSEVLEDTNFVDWKQKVDMLLSFYGYKDIICVDKPPKMPKGVTDDLAVKANMNKN
ncbi:PREDICTED: F-box/FBD/LRR-repeat protein At1g13570-like [Ipomoea nil]|uniref:F-box/FBD/LRR-repeat protein At1g13570-like n=1 Tax=Ipomoea nil TaxID=35883 RepID=UPI000900FA95|nr:PREDICTED: F-box/FBD/LRR-repeat protein At1g13570-like [Ipomoea nil]